MKLSHFLQSRISSFQLDKALRKCLLVLSLTFHNELYVLSAVLIEWSMQPTPMAGDSCSCPISLMY